MPVVSRALEVDFGDRDPKQEIFDEVAPYLPGFRVGGSMVLIAVFTREGETKLKGSSLYIAGNTAEEDRYQGKTGLVLKFGPHAYVGERTGHFDVDPVIGDWVMFDVRNGFSFILGKRVCRLIQWNYLEAIVDRPDTAM